MWRYSRVSDLPQLHLINVYVPGVIDQERKNTIRKLRGLAPPPLLDRGFRAIPGQSYTSRHWDQDWTSDDMIIDGKRHRLMFWVHHWMEREKELAYRHDKSGWPHYVTRLAGEKWLRPIDDRKRLLRMPVAELIATISQDEYLRRQIEQEIGSKHWFEEHLQFRMIQREPSL